MFKFIPSFQSFFVANQTNSSASSLFARTDKQTSGQKSNQKLKEAISLQRMAREVESSQPNLAAELRNFASR